MKPFLVEDLIVFDNIILKAAADLIKVLFSYPVSGVSSNFIRRHDQVQMDMSLISFIGMHPAVSHEIGCPFGKIASTQVNQRFAMFTFRSVRRSLETDYFVVKIIRSRTFR
jgi:hypothetical protein